ncbi:MAG: translocation/assembly module TamB domain-containing protein, partial [Myxococcota bacterium]
RHPVGEATIVSGQIDLVQETVNLQTDLLLPTLQRLDQFGLDGFRGSVRARGPVAVRYGGDEPAVDVGLRVDGRNIGSPDFELAAVRSSDLTVKVRGSTVSWSGGATVEGLNASGVLIESIALSELSGQYLPTGELSASTAVDLSSLIVGDGTFVLNGLSGTVDGGVDASGQPVLATNLVLGEMAVEPIGFALDGGPLELTLAEDALMARVSLSRKERLVIETIARGDLEAGHWTIEELFVFPAEDRGLANPVSVPIEFDLVEDGVDNVKAVLVLSSQRPDDVNPRQVSLQEASTLTFTGATLGGLPDIRVDAQRVNMNWVSAMANTFLSEGDELFLPVMEGVLDGHVALEGEADEASVDGDLHLKGFVYPEQAEDINVDLALEGRLGRPTATMRVSGPKKLIAAMDAVVPLNVEEGYTIDCESDLGVRALLAPRSLDALGARLPALAGMPAGSISGDAYVFGDACDPEIHVFGMFSGPVGVHGEYARLDARIERKGEDLDLAMNLIEGGLRWMRVDGHVTHRLADVFAMTLGGGPAIDLNDPSAIITDFEVRASPTNVSLPLLAQLGGADLELDGDLRGALVVSGTPGEPVVHGDLSIVKGRIGDVRLNQAEVHLHPANESDKDGYLMDVDFAFGRANGQGRHSGRPLRLALDGFVPVTLAEMIYDEDPMSDTGWRLTIEDGAIPMELMNGVSDAVIDVSGTLLFGGEIKEDLVNPSSRLDLQVHDGQMILTDPVDVHYEHMDIGMSLDAGTFQIHRGHLVPPSSDEDQGLRNPCFDKEQAGADPRQLGGCFSATPRYAQLNVGRIGMLELLGGFSLNGFTPEKLRFEMTMQDFWLAASNQFQFATTGGMTMTGDWPAFTLRGDVTLNQGAVNLDSTFFSADASLKLDDRITIQNRNDGSRELVVAAPEDDLTSEVFEKFDAKVSLNLNNKLNLEMEYPLSTDFGQQFAELSSFLMDVELDGALEAGMTEGDIFVSGDVEITDGTASTLGREFSVEPDSTITFTGKDYTNPFVDLSARYTTSSYGDVLMSVNGFVSPTVPTPAFSSENGPQEYDETDIMSLLLLGKPASTLADSEGESNSYLLSAALSSLSGQVGGALTGSFVDEVDIDPQQGVRVGKALSERLFLTYDWNSDADETDNVNEVALEWTISPSLYAEFLTGDRAQSSVSLFWRRIFGVASSDAPKAPPPSPAPAPAPEPTPEPGAEDPTSAPAPTP